MWHERRFREHDLCDMDANQFAHYLLITKYFPNPWTLGMFGLNLKPRPGDDDCIEVWQDPVTHDRWIRWTDDHTHEHPVQTKPVTV